jgi:hypothetical protein
VGEDEVSLAKKFNSYQSLSWFKDGANFALSKKEEKKEREKREREREQSKKRKKGEREKRGTKKKEKWQNEKRDIKKGEKRNKKKVRVSQHAPHRSKATSIVPPSHGIAPR